MVYFRNWVLMVENVDLTGLFKNLCWVIQNPDRIIVIVNVNFVMIYPFNKGNNETITKYNTNSQMMHS